MYDQELIASVMSEMSDGELEAFWDVLRKDIIIDYKTKNDSKFGRVNTNRNTTLKWRGKNKLW